METANMETQEINDSNNIMVTKNTKNAKETQRESKMFRWDTRHSRYLCKYLAEQVQNGMKVDKGFKSAYLNQLVRAVNKEFNVDINITNVKNHLRTLQKKWKDIQEILKNSSGAYVDYDKGILVMDERTADEYIQAHPKAAPLINKPIDNYHEIRLIFSDDKATGEYCVGSRSNPTMSSSSSMPEEKATPVESFPAVVDLDGKNPFADDLGYNTKSTKGSSSSSKAKEKTLKRPRGSDDDVEQIISQVRLLADAIKEAGEHVASLGMKGEVEVNRNVIKEVMKVGKKNNMGKRELFVKAKKLISNPDNVKFFLALPDEMRAEWLEMEFGV